MPAFPWIEFTLGVGTWETADLVYPDTGFDGGIAIPAGVGREVLAEPDTTPLRLADGSVRLVRTWIGSLELDGHAFSTEVVALGERYLPGREVLDQLEICFEYGRTVNLRFRT